MIKSLQNLIKNSSLIKSKFISFYLISANKQFFGILSEYNERLNKKLQNTHQLDEKPQFFVTSVRPGNFGDHTDFKVNIDNWFDENRVHNEHETDIRRTQIYALTAVYYGGLLSFARLYAMGVIGRLNGWKRYDRDTYMEVDIGELPPAEVMQIVWNGMPVFIRRLTKEEAKEQDSLPLETQLDSEQPIVSDAGETKVIVTSAVCTHLGCIPLPYLGAYNGYVCICHGSVYDKLGRVRSGPAMKNLPYVNNSVLEEGTLLCIEEMLYPREPSLKYWT